MNSIIRRLLRDQSGVVARRQALAAGLMDHDIRRLLRRREWAIVHDGVYVNHTGEPTWLQLAWAGVLFAWPAALSHDSAIRVADGPGRRDRQASDPIHVAVDRDRAFAAPAGIVPHRLGDFHAKVQWNLGPPRVRVEQAVLDVAAESRSEFAATPCWRRPSRAGGPPPSASRRPWRGARGYPAARSSPTSSVTWPKGRARSSSTATSSGSSARTAFLAPTASSSRRRGVRSTATWTTAASCWSSSSTGTCPQQRRGPQPRPGP